MQRSKLPVRHMRDCIPPARSSCSRTTSPLVSARERPSAELQTLNPDSGPQLNFGYIYGLFLVGCLSIWLVMTLMSKRGMDVYQVMRGGNNTCTSAVSFVPFLSPWVEEGGEKERDRER